MPLQIGVQLYSVREQLAQDFVGTMKRVAEIGFAGVETAFFNENIKPKEAKQLFDDLGLKVIAAHCPLPLGEQLEPTIALLDELDCYKAIWHGWPEDSRYQTLDGIRELAAQYEEASFNCHLYGSFTFGLHNHWWEFEQTEGEMRFDFLRSLLYPEIFFELDTYWIQTAGLNPAQVIKKMGARAPLLHLKDGPATKDGVMVPIGTGKMDTISIINAAQEKAKWLIVELDAVEGDIFEALEQSYRFLKDHI